MTGGYSTLDVLRGASVVAVALLTLLLLLTLRAPGYRTSRLVLFAVVALVGWVGATGAVYDRAKLLFVGALGQFLLGFWNFTIGLFMLPTAAILLANAMALEQEQPTE
ncbi:hypothetical protein G9C85_14275 [Halorubellus sp. JP-L1]|uniref:hypothetical protein n=1 Tax=Halorubellus sp. JP-L1 TaxID=2715753 RepID=UPI0014088BFF|nr:hypothetical protein [Halorubellus sp. JP-L1]NHN42787.1 hypothetical protein [Halorubellus sp. JP-L1]